MDKRAPEFVVDQSLCYSPATNYYGYYCTGFEAPSEWDGHQRFFGLGGSDPHYAGMCVEDLPHVYYTPSYEFAHSPYNPYNPYVPGAILGVDGSFIGEQQYYAGSPYEHHTPSPTYYPLALQSKIDSIPTSVWEPRSLNTSVSSAIKLDRPGLKRPSSASVGIMKVPTQPSSGNVKSELAEGAGYQTHSLPRISEAAVSKQPVVHTNITSSGAPATTPPLASQGKDVSGPTHASNQFSYERSPSLHAPLKVSLPVTNGSSNFDVIGVRPRSQYGEVSSNGKGSSDFLREQNRGPRTSKDKSQWTSTISVKAYTKTTTHNVEDDITINADQYNKEDFPVNYTDGKFFVIKSYSEDDVHKSIKYNVWSSTTNGNKRLDSAYEDAQRIAFERSRGCPIFLFFSVNASGQFCGVAEMIGPVDFHKDMDFWQHDKWNGSFPVKWHFLKDVPNNNFRHIILENNDNRPVTNSRDTQEIRYKQGMEMLHIFKNYPMKTSILDDFIYYEDRQKIMTEQKSRYLSKNYNRSFYAPAFALDKSNVLVDHSPSAGEKNPIRPGDPNSPTHEQVPEEVHTKPNDNNSSSEVDNMKLNVVGDVDDASVSNTDSLTIDSQQAAEAKSSVAVASMVGTPVDDDIVTVGSMPIKVNGFTDASGSFKVGTIPIHLEGLKLDNSGMPTAGRSLL